MEQKYVKRVIGSIIYGILLCSCTAIEKSNARGIEELLLAAGFEKQMADSPEKNQQIQAMQQRAVFSKEENGATKYYYADVEFCHCVYVGTEADYQRYQELQAMPVSPESEVNPSLDWYWP